MDGERSARRQRPPLWLTTPIRPLPAELAALLREPTTEHAHGEASPEDEPLEEAWP